jgi:CelD/BcsL family acetyltransferase involved in cellulose biosynthesis
MHAISSMRTSRRLRSGTQVHLLQAVEGLAAVWDSVRMPWKAPTSQYIWAKAWADTFGNEYRVRLLVAGPLEAPTAIAPLVERRGGPRRLELLGVTELWEPMDFIWSDRDALRSIAVRLGVLARPLALKRLPATSAVPAALRASLRRRSLIVQNGMPGCPFIVLDGGWVEPEQSFNADRRSDLRRARRLAEREGPVTLEVLTPAAADVGPLLREAVQVESLNWKGRQGTALLAQPGRAAFFERYARAAAGTGVLRLCFLRIAGRAVATQIALEWAERFWLLKIGYDEAFRRCSPGTLLMLHTIAYSAGRGLRSYEFLGTAQPWTEHWTKLVRPMIGFRTFPARPAGVVTLASDGAGLVRRWGLERDG